MTRAMKPVSASVGGVEIVVTESARRRIRRAAREAATKIDRIPRGNQKKIAAIAAIARRAGMSYGMFVAEERKNRYGQSKT